MTLVNLSLSEIHDLALEAFTQNGCDSQNAGALTRTVVAAERDGSHSHGLFRVPGYVASLRSGKVKGAAEEYALMREADLRLSPQRMRSRVPFGALCQPWF